VPQTNRSVWSPLSVAASGLYSSHRLLSPSPSNVNSPWRIEIAPGFPPAWARGMVRPCVARGFVNLADAVLHQCIRPLIGAYCAAGHHGYQRAFELISGQASNGPFGSPVFACAGKTNLHRRLILSQTSAGKGVGYVIDSSSLRAVPCSCLAVVPSSRPARADAPRARAVKAGRRAVLTSCSTAARLRLDGPEHCARIKQVGTPSPPS
jgi:hypothetical protein